jgi:membrane protein DedA with SNARE-associated domain
MQYFCVNLIIRRIKVCYFRESACRQERDAIGSVRRWLHSHINLLARTWNGMSAAGRRRFILVVTAWAVVTAAGLVARAFLPLLVRDHPLLLVILDARTSNLLLASPKINVADFIIVGVIWRFTVHSLYYLLGRWYGDRTLRWAIGTSSLRRGIIDRVERVFGRFANPAVFLLSHKLVCVLAGTAGMSPLRFVVLHLSGTVLHIIALCLFARSTHAPISQIVVLIDRNAFWLTVAFVVVTVALIIWSARLHYRRFQEQAVLLTVDESDETSQTDTSTIGEHDEQWDGKADS